MKAKQTRSVLALLSWMSLVFAVIKVPEAAAQGEGAPAPDAPTKAVVGILGVEQIENKVREIEGSADLPQETRDNLLEIYKAAMNRLQQAAAFTAQSANFKTTLETAPQESERIRALLERPSSQPATRAALAEKTVAELEQDLTSVQAELANRRNALKTLDGELELQKARPAEARAQLSEAKQKLEAIDEEERRPPSDSALPALAEARKALLAARQRARLVEVEALEQELVSHDARLNLLSLRREQLARESASLEASAKQLQETVNKRRIAEAQQEREKTEQAAEESLGKHAVIQRLASQNAEWGRRLEETNRKLERFTKRAARVAQDREALEKAFKSSQERIDRLGLSAVVGQVLRQQRRELPQAPHFEEEARAWEQELERVTLELLEIEEQLSEFATIEKPLRMLLEPLAGTVPDTRLRGEIEPEVRQLLTAQKDLLQKLRGSDRTYLSTLGELDSAQRDLIVAARRYAGFLDEHLLWIRSSAPIDLRTPGQAVQAISWFAEPANWGEAGRAGARAFSSNLPLTALLVGALALLGVLSRTLRARVKWIQPRVGKVRTDSFALTLQALTIHLLLALPAPLVLGFLAWRVNQDTGAGEFPKAVAAGLGSVAALWLAFGLLRRVVRPDGVAQVHFRWRELTLSVLRRKSLWLIGIALITPAVFVVSTLQAQGSEVYQDSLGRLTFLFLMLAVAFVTARLFQPERGLFAERLLGSPGGWLSRLRHVWYPLFVAVPIALAILASFGYYYTTLELGGGRLLATILLILGATLVQNLIQRWVYIVHRRLAFEQALEERKARLAAAQQAAAQQAAAPLGKPDTAVVASGSGTPIEVEEPQVDLAQVNAQARYLLGTFVGASVIIGLWFIWGGVFPALNTKSVELWSYTAAGGENQRVTLQDLGLALVILVIAGVASRNIPGALELMVLQKLPIEAGGRYAITTLCQYFLVLLGVVLASNAIGVGWSQVQWLVAAVSLGLGFGLQEIFANFVSGLILLFERPIRVGDVVTVGDVSGVVTRIRIRATTITNWERKELIVPNKEFVTGRLLNWTLSDATNRVLIEVGVAYGSDTERARTLLLEVASAHPLILKDPPPVAIFEAFGDSTLKLVLRCFLPDLENRLATIHDLHTAVDKAFREAGIEIAFPQRDLHLRSAEASLQVRQEREQGYPVEQSGEIESKFGSPPT